MPTVAVWKESSRENSDLKCFLSRQLINFKNWRNFDERTKVLAPTVFTTYSSWQRGYEPIWNLLTMAS
jgi:hypothetical protein